MFIQRRWEDRPQASDIERCFTPADTELTRLEIARRLGVKKNRHLIGLLDEMAASGRLIASTARLLNGVDAITYRLP